MALGGAATGASAHDPTVTEYDTGLSAGSGPWDIVDGGDGQLWFTAEDLGVLAPLAAEGGLVGEVVDLVLGDAPKGIAKGADGNLWVAQAGLTPGIARVTPAAEVTEFDTGLLTSQPWDVAAGPDGNLWFVSRDPAFIGRITPAGTITQFSAGLSAGSLPSAITAGADGNLWFTESADPGRIGRITPEGAITEYSTGLPPNMAPTDITLGPDENLWFTLSGGAGAIGKITPGGEIQVFTEGLTPNSEPTGIARGTDDALWFTEAADPGRIGRITKSGAITEYEGGLTDNRAPWMITPGPDGNMWFTENADPGAIGRISLPPHVRGQSVQYLSDNSARLPAKIRPNAQETRFWFEYGPTKDYALKSETGSAGDGWEHTEVSIRVGDLKAGTKYYFRVVADNGSGETVGGHGSFETLPAAIVESDPRQVLEPVDNAVEHLPLPDRAKPRFGEAVVAHPQGEVRVKVFGAWHSLPTSGAALPLGIPIDARDGKVELTSMDRAGEMQTGTFGGGVLEVRQPSKAEGRVDVHLRGGKWGRCKRLGRRSRKARRPASASSDASASARRRKRGVRRLWARDGGGRFRTHGRHSHATVRGTRWLTADRCNGTFTRVTRGSVVVRDLVRGKRVVVRAGESYFARRPRR